MSDVIHLKEFRAGRAMASEPPPPAFTKGALLAIAMLEELGTFESMAECAFEAEWRKGKPQRDLVGEYVARLSEDPEELRGFTTMLSYTLACEMEGSGPRIDSAYLGLMARMSPEKAEAEWERMTGKGAAL